MSHAIRSKGHTSEPPLLLSIFPGIDLLRRAFEEERFCVVRGPDLITGGDIRRFHPPKGSFAGVIGGPPCQDFSLLNHNPGDYGDEMIAEYCRVIDEAQPEWFLFENVVAAPSFTIPGYRQQRFALDLAWFSAFSRRRDFVFGSRSGVLIDPLTGTSVTSSDERSFSACCEIQGLPHDFDLPFFSLKGKKHAVANTVPMALGRYVARLIAKTFYTTDSTVHRLDRQRQRPRGCRSRLLRFRNLQKTRAAGSRQNRRTPILVTLFQSRVSQNYAPARHRAGFNGIVYHPYLT